MKRLNKLCRIIVVLSAVGMIIDRFTSPGLPETELFIREWPLICLMIISAVNIHWEEFKCWWDDIQLSGIPAPPNPPEPEIPDDD